MERQNSIIQWQFVWIIAISLFGFFPVLGQAQPWKVNGYVLDAETGEPLIGARIKLEGENTGCITDENGRFYLPVRVAAPVISATFLGYESMVLRTTRASGEPLIFHLRPSSVQISGVTIYNNRVEPAYPDPTLHIQDYTFYGDQLLLASWSPELKGIQLLLVNEQDSVLFRHPGIQDQKGDFATDCLGNRYLLTQKKAYQIFIDPAGIFLLPSDREEFDKFALPCAGMINNTFFIHRQVNDYVEYYERVDGKDLSHKMMVVIQDSQKLRHQQDDALLKSKGIDPIGQQSRNAQQATTLKSADEMFKKNGYMSPNYSPMEIIRGNALIFSHPQNKLMEFTEEGELIHTVPIQYHKERAWAKKVFSDEEEQNVYTLTEKKGLYHLHLIDTDSGEITHSWDLEKPFLTHIMVKNGFAYFLYRESNEDTQKRLWRIRL